MISKPSASECFVYITLPGEVSAVTAGRFVLQKNTRGDAVGQFVYRGKYLDDPQAVEIDPIELKLSARTYETARLNGVFGALRDAGPDYWGRRVIEKHAGKAVFGELDYLLESPDDRAGALGFGLNNVPPAPRRKFNKTLDLEKLQALADALVRDDLPNDPEAPQIQELLLLGTSMGGARPKAVVQDDDGLWVAKFGRADDRWNNPRVEHAMLRLAHECGITTAESRMETVGGRDVLLVKRFDREKTAKGYTRARMVSGLTILRADEAPETRRNRSYVILVEELRRIVTEPKKAGADAPVPLLSLGQCPSRSPGRSCCGAGGRGHRRRRACVRKLIHEGSSFFDVGCRSRSRTPGPPPSLKFPAIREFYRKIALHGRHRGTSRALPKH
jgi:serine/threonine-protein kinase HipA